MLTPKEVDDLINRTLDEMLDDSDIYYRAKEHAVATARRLKIRDAGLMLLSELLDGVRYHGLEEARDLCVRLKLMFPT